MARAAHAWPFGIINLFGARKPGPCSAKVAELREVAGAGPQASSYSQNDVAGTMQRFASPTRRWCTAHPDLDRFRPIVLKNPQNAFAPNSRICAASLGIPPIGPSKGVGSSPAAKVVA